MQIRYYFPGLLIILTLIIGCGDGNNQQPATPKAEEPVAEAETDPMKNKGIGPISNLTLDAINTDLAGAGEVIFQEKCTACHKVDKRYIGPALKDITGRRTPEWIMNMILNPEEMVSKDPIARQLLMEFSAPMANQSLTEEEARKVLEYFRTI